MSDKVTLTYRGQSIEVDADALYGLMEDAFDRMGDRLEEVERYPDDDWNHELIVSLATARRSVVTLLSSGAEEVDKK